MGKRNELTIACHFSLRRSAVGGAFCGVVESGFCGVAGGGYGVALKSDDEHVEYVVHDVSVEADLGVGSGAGNGANAGEGACGCFSVIGVVSASGFGSSVSLFWFRAGADAGNVGTGFAIGLDSVGAVAEVTFVGASAFGFGVIALADAATVVGVDGSVCEAAEPDANDGSGADSSMGFDAEDVIDFDAVDADWRSDASITTSTILMTLSLSFLTFRSVFLSHFLIFFSSRDIFFRNLFIFLTFASTMLGFLSSSLHEPLEGN